MTELDPPTILCQRCDTTTRFPYSVREYVVKGLWFVVQSTLFRLPLPRLSGWRRMLLRCFGASIDPTAVVSSTVTVWHPWLLKVGEYSALSDRVCVYNLGWIVIGSHTVVSQDVYLCGGTHDYTKTNLPLVRKSIVVGHGVWLCAGVFIGPGVTVGDNAIVGARAVVMSDVPPRVVTFGNPARVIRDRPMPDSDEGLTGTGSQAGGNESH